MHVLIATDGNLDPAAVSPLVTPLAQGGLATVLTVVEVPRALLSELRGVFGEQQAATVDADAEYVAAPGPGAVPRSWPGDDAVIRRYLDDQRALRADPMAEELSQRGVTVTTDVREGEDAAEVILDAAEDSGADLVVIGARGRGRMRDLIGSTGTKVMRLCPRPVLLVR